MAAQNRRPSGWLTGGMMLAGGLSGLADELDRKRHEKIMQDHWQQEMDLRKQEMQARLEQAHSEQDRQKRIDDYNMGTDTQVPETTLPEPAPNWLARPAAPAQPFDQGKFKADYQPQTSTFPTRHIPGRFDREEALKQQNADSQAALRQAQADLAEAKSVQDPMKAQEAALKVEDLKWKIKNTQSEINQREADKFRGETGTDAEGNPIPWAWDPKHPDRPAIRIGAPIGVTPQSPKTSAQIGSLEAGTKQKGAAADLAKTRAAQIQATADLLSGATGTAPSQPKYKEGDTATGPNGQKAIFKDGAWMIQK